MRTPSPLIDCGPPPPFKEITHIPTVPLLNVPTAPTLTPPKILQSPLIVQKPNHGNHQIPTTLLLVL